MILKNWHALPLIGIFAVFAPNIRCVNRLLRSGSHVCGRGVGTNEDAMTLSICAFALTNESVQYDGIHFISIMC